ncbi:hypothetical protein AB3X55_03855 [Alphaproteobacteria bacterium LSUCC0719]
MLKTLNLNRFLGLLNPDFVDQFRDEFPHLYLPQNAGIGLRHSGLSSVFEEFAIKLIIQHWFTANDLDSINTLKDELRRKEDGLYDARLQGYGMMHADESQPDQVDPAFDRLMDEIESKAREEAESYEDFDPDSDGEMGIAHHEIMGLAESAVDGREQEIMMRSFVSLRRVLNEGLKDISDRWRELKEPDWQDVEKLEGEAKYVHLLRQLETNFPGRGISAFTKKSGTLFELNSLRNDVEHKKRKNDDDHHNTQNLIECFKEIKALMECMEQIDREMVIWF